MEKGIIERRAIRLAGEMIKQGIIDIQKKKDGGYPYRNEALIWFRSRDQNVCGYGWCLRLTGFRPNLIRSLINQALEGKLRNKYLTRDRDLTKEL